MRAQQTPQTQVHLSMLLERFGELLADRQREFLKLYCDENLSFGEIAVEQGVSRQAVYDAVRTGRASLERFEQVWAGCPESAGFNREVVQALLAKLETMTAHHPAQGTVIELRQVLGLDEIHREQENYV